MQTLDLLCLRGCPCFAGHGTSLKFMSTTLRLFELLGERLQRAAMRLLQVNPIALDYDSFLARPIYFL
ncbi:hypothetical protein [Tahibacter soli]|uniref:Uncharacterized protein n=1 Tax=Tahibacter soli TaxID=2983605 RepID=A0A9X3YKE0_9GAMM|nr:hypothetical protein [Tahibacter soli]MDC8012805.1 hypothetical protein [Tahibacter soli]